MDKKIKDYIAEKKLTDEEIYKLLTAESSDAVEGEQDGNAGEEPDVDNESDEQDSEGEEDASEQEQPDIEGIIKETVAKVVAEELGKMKRGKRPPKITKKISKKKIIQSDYSKSFGEL